MPYRITKNCNQCERCAEVCAQHPNLSDGLVWACAQGAIERDKNYKFFIHKNDCDECGECVKVCPVSAIAWEGRL